MRAILTVMLATMLAEPALAQAVTSVDTELVKGRCRFIDDDGEVGDYALKRCPGLAGARVFTEASPSHVSLHFRWDKTKTDNIVTGYSLGEKLEWRGTKDKRGFTPIATIVRIIVRDDASIDDQGRYKTYNVLAVIRMERRDACEMAAIDEAANPDALALARATADAEAAKFVCRKDRERIVGKSTQWARQALGLPPEPRQ